MNNTNSGLLADILGCLQCAGAPVHSFTEDNMSGFTPNELAQLNRVQYVLEIYFPDLEAVDIADVINDVICIADTRSTGGHDLTDEVLLRAVVAYLGLDV